MPATDNMWRQRHGFVQLDFDEEMSGHLMDVRASDGAYF